MSDYELPDREHIETMEEVRRNNAKREAEFEAVLGSSQEITHFHPEEVVIIDPEIYSAEEVNVITSRIRDGVREHRRFALLTSLAITNPRDQPFRPEEMVKRAFALEAAFQKACEEDEHRSV